MDEQGEPLGYNEIGEIVVRSKYLSPGYWRNPELTSAKFKNDPGTMICIYHTGDLGLMLPDGCLIHKGRKDFRVKIRGYGVEIGEVEQALREQSEIQDTVVVAKETESGEVRLVAYLTSPVQPKPDIRQVRTMLRTKLPDYMIPSSFVLLDTLPLTSNGKLDRRALPDPGNTRPDLNNLCTTVNHDGRAAHFDMVRGIVSGSNRHSRQFLRPRRPFAGRFSCGHSGDPNIWIGAVRQGSFRRTDGCRDGGYHCAEPSQSGKR